MFHCYWKITASKIMLHPLLEFHQVAPHNTFYSQLGKHIKEVGIDPTTNKWNEPLALGAVDLHDSLSHPSRASDAQAQTATCVDPDQFVKFLVCIHVLLVNNFF